MCFSFAISIFSNLSFSSFSSFNLLASSFFKILYCEIVSAILSKNAWINFSKPKLNLKLNSGFNEFWKFNNFNKKPCFFGLADLIFIGFFCFLFFFFFRMLILFIILFFILILFGFLNVFFTFFLALLCFLEILFFNFFFFFSF